MAYAKRRRIDYDAYRRSAIRAGVGVGKLVGKGLRFYRDYKRRGSKRQQSNAPIVTNQFDVRRQYRRRPAPRRLRRKMRSWAYRVNKTVAEEQLGSKTVQRSIAGTVTWADGNQGRRSLVLYSCDANVAADTDDNDLKIIFQQEFGSTSYSGKRLLIDSAVMEIVFRNSDESNTAFLDVYTVVC